MITHFSLMSFWQDLARRNRPRCDFVRSRCGFSALELLMATALILAVGSITLPRLLQMRNAFSLQGNLRLVQVMVHTARYDAISQGAQYQIVVQKTPTPRIQLQADSARNPQSPNFVNVGAPVPMAQNVQFAKGGNILCDYSGTVTTTGLDVDATSGESYVSMTNGTRVFYVYVSRLGRIRVVQVS
jgi:type II secretory pathway pseudopilin PulG